MSEGRLDVLTVREDAKTSKSYFTKVGVAFPNKKGDGYSILLDALPVSGKLLLRPPLPKRDAAPDDDLPF